MNNEIKVIPMFKPLEKWLETLESYGLIFENRKLKMKEQKIRGHKLLLKVIVGSQAYGTSTPESDIDYKGIYLQNIDEIAMGQYKEQITVTDDEVYYEFKRFLDLLAKNNPTIIEMLNCPEDCIVYKHPMLDEIFKNRDGFLSKLCRNSYGGMAKAQMSKAKGLNKKMNIEREKIVRKGLLDFCYISVPSFNGSRTIAKYCADEGIEQRHIGLTNIPHMFDCYQVYIDHSESNGVKGWAHGVVKEGGNESNQLRLSSVPKGVVSIGVLNFNINGYKKHCKDYNEYMKWLENRNTQRYVDINEHGQQIDGKNMLHCRRILSMGVEIAKGMGCIVRRPDADALLDIRKGKVNLEELMKMCDEDLKTMDNYFMMSDLPDKPDRTLLDKMLKNVRKQQLIEFNAEEF